MEYIILFAIILAYIFYFFYFKNYLPSFVNKKAENFATKQDIKEITKLTEEVQQEFRFGLKLFSSDLEFKYKYYYDQLQGLYAYLYAIVAQSEYTRKYLKSVQCLEISSDEVPFLQTSKLQVEKETYNCKEGILPKYRRDESFVETPVSKYCFKEIVESIIKNGVLAEPNLLKLAISHRYLTTVENPENADDRTKEEEIKMETEIIKMIVKTYNRLRKELKMEYNQSEMDNGCFELANI